MKRGVKPRRRRSKQSNPHNRSRHARQCDCFEARRNHYVVVADPTAVCPLAARRSAGWAMPGWEWRSAPAAWRTSRSGGPVDPGYSPPWASTWTGPPYRLSPGLQSRWTSWLIASRLSGAAAYPDPVCRHARSIRSSRRPSRRRSSRRLTDGGNWVWAWSPQARPLGLGQGARGGRGWPKSVAEPDSIMDRFRDLINPKE